MAQKSISQLDTAATLDTGDLFETAIPDAGSASGYASKKMTLAQLADFAANDIVYPDFDTNAKSITGAVNQTLANFAPEYSSSETYEEGAVVIYAGNLYRCDTAISTPETFTPAKWTQGTAADFFSGGGVTLDRILEAYAADDAQDNVIPRTTWDVNNYNSAFLSFDAQTHKWTVLQNCEVTVIMGVRQYRATTGSIAFEDFYTWTNGGMTKRMTATASGYTAGSVGYAMNTYQLTAGQEIGFGKSGSAGWEAPYVLIVLGRLTDELFLFNTEWQEGS